MGTVGQNATYHHTGHQGGHREGCHARRLTRVTLGGTALLLLGGCYKFPDQLNPEIWWHNLEGGPIAQQRPPPPNADLPYPNLATVPPRPTPSDPAARQRLSNALLADRADAQYAASQNPIAAVPRVAPPPTPAADPDASSASLEASGGPANQVPPVRTAGVTSPTTPPGGADTKPAAAAPEIPPAPPPPPVLPGISIGPTVPVPPIKAPPTPPTPQTISESARAPVPVAFAAGSAVLAPGADGPLKQLAQRRAGKPINIIGFGEANDSMPDAQNAGITLGLARARAVAAVLLAAGVPANSLRIDAQAVGRGADARLVD